MIVPDKALDAMRVVDARAVGAGGAGFADDLAMEGLSTGAHERDEASTDNWEGRVSPEKELRSMLCEFVPIWIYAAAESNCRDECG